MTLPPAYAGMRVGLMGGSFNPPHEGHRRIAVEALKRLGLSQVWLIVTPGNPLKGRAGLPELKDRIGAARRVVRHPRLVVTGFEAELPTAFTIDTLRYVRRARPGVRFTWIMGADNLAGFHRWRGWREIMALMPVAVFERPGWRYAALASRTAHAYTLARAPDTLAMKLASLAPPRWTFISQPPIAISSTELREAGRRP
jgi:nicotinate-nucleotide adenylyltransferase